MERENGWGHGCFIFHNQRPTTVYDRNRWEACPFDWNINSLRNSLQMKIRLQKLASKWVVPHKLCTWPTQPFWAMLIPSCSGCDNRVETWHHSTAVPADAGRKHDCVQTNRRTESSSPEFRAGRWRWPSPSSRLLVDALPASRTVTGS